jgi:hypothetical protein
MNAIPWIQHWWPDGFGFGHITKIPCSDTCQYPGVVTTWHDDMPPLSWEPLDEEESNE